MWSIVNFVYLEWSSRNLDYCVYQRVKYFMFSTVFSIHFLLLLHLKLPGFVFHFPKKRERVLVRFFCLFEISTILWLKWTEKNYTEDYISCIWNRTPHESKKHVYNESFNLEDGAANKKNDKKNSLFIPNIISYSWYRFSGPKEAKRKKNCEQSVNSAKSWVSNVCYVGFFFISSTVWIAAFFAQAIIRTK